MTKPAGEQPKSRWLTRISRERERKMYFYLTMVCAALWLINKAW